MALPLASVAQSTVSLQGMLGSKALLIVNGGAPRAVAPGDSLQGVKVLSTNLAATRDRYEIGDLTRTDVAQSESRLAIARSQLQAAEARLIASRDDSLPVLRIGSPQTSQPPVR